MDWLDVPWFELVLYGVGWTLGWVLLARPRHLPPSPNAADREPIAVIIPARDEASSLPHLLGPLGAQRRPGDQIVVVDDHSTDGTAEIAASFGVDVVAPPDLPEDWRGKPHACWHGTAATAAETLVFLDADVRPGPTLLDDLVAAVDRHPDAVVSVQPWHAIETTNVTALMGCGAFTPFGDRAAATVAFGPVLALRRTEYDRIGGHADPTIRAMHTEDIGIARAVGRSRLFVGAPDATTFRMYPGGVRELIAGWTRTIATGARFTPWWLLIATLGWVWSLAGGWLATPLLYPLSAVQVWVLGRRAGRITPLAALLFPILVVVFVVVFLRSAFALVLGREVGWKGRRVPARAG